MTNFASTVSLLTGAGRPPAVIGTGTETWNYPFRTYWHDSRTQCIYLASELGGAGTINSLTLDVVTIPGQVMNNWTIRVKHTALSSYATNSWESTGWTTAYQANQPRGATGPVTFVFSTPFAYDGSSNLMVDFSHNNTSYTLDGAVRSTTTATNRSLIYYTDSYDGDPLTWSGASPTPQPVARIPNITLTFSGNVVSMTPATTTNFVNGLWSGPVTVAQVFSALTLRADDGAGHIGTSNAFNVVLPPVPVVTSPTSASAAVGQPFSYKILATNFIASYNAANLPAGLGVNSATGLITGTPTASGTTAVTVSAINAGGSGNATLSLQVQADADGDGMGDAWETANGLSPANGADASTDLDGDGKSNRAEWLAGTAPNSSTSHLRILTQVIAGSNVQLTWGAVVARRYRVLTRTDLVGGLWTDLTPTPIVATTATGSYTHVGGFTGGAGYYRIEIVP